MTNGPKSWSEMAGVMARMLSMAARVLLFGLWTEADDQGVFDWKPITIKMRILPVDNVDVPELLAELERRLVRDAMQSAGGNQSEAARRLGISRVGLIKKLARLGLR